MMAAVGHQPSPQQQQQQPTPQQTTQLEFNQAMKDFKTMFPEMDEDVIEVVLRANQGAVDATIDQLLAMSTDNENERIRTEMDATENAEAPPGYSPTTPPPTYQQAVPYSQLSASPSVGTSATAAAAHCSETKTAAVSGTSSMSLPRIGADGGASHSQLKSASVDTASATTPVASSSPQSVDCSVPLRVKRNWAPPILGPLPCDFLRISMPNGRIMKAETNMTTELWSEVLQQKMEENRRQRKMRHPEDPELTQYLEDERIALFLQNEEFMKELRSNKDFLTTLERDESDSDTEKPSSESVGAFPYTKSFPTEESDAAFREKLKNMGKLSRRKFAQLARLFSRQKKRSAKQMYPYARLSEGSMPSKDNLLLDQDGNEDGSESDVEDSTRPQNEYHLIKNSSSPSHHSNTGSSSKHD